jgi:hypothetical protein
MRLVSKNCGATVSLGLAIGLMGLISGCDGGGQTTDSKPIETDILKKLGKASQAQSAGANAEHARAGAKNKR